MKISEYTTSKDRLKEIAGELLRAADSDIPEYGFHVSSKDGGRTGKQNSAIHVYCRLLAKALNEAGLDMRTMLRADIAVPWTIESVKENLWRPIQLALLEKYSTKDLERPEVSDVYKVLDRALGEKLGVHVPFPQNRHPE